MNTVVAETWPNASGTARFHRIRIANAQSIHGSAWPLPEAAGRRRPADTELHAENDVHLLRRTFPDGADDKDMDKVRLSGTPEPGHKVYTCTATFHSVGVHY